MGADGRNCFYRKPILIGEIIADEQDNRWDNYACNLCVRVAD